MSQNARVGKKWLLPLKGVEISPADANLKHTYLHLIPGRRRRFGGIFKTKLAWFNKYDGFHVSESFLLY